MTSVHTDSRPVATSGPPFRTALALIGACSVGLGVLGIRILSAGYGADNDTWLMLGTWDGVRRFGHYVPSRFQGAPLPEFLIGAASTAGGHVLAGAVSVTLGLIGGTAMYRLARSRTTRASDAAIATALACSATPFVIAATTSHDYIYGFALFFVGIALTERRGDLDVLGAVVFGLSVASRVSYLPLALTVVVLCRPDRPRSRRLSCAAVVAVVSVLSYVPAFVAARGSLRFLSATEPAGQGFVGIVGRAVFKGADFFGIVGTVLLAGTIVLLWRRRPAVWPPRADLHLVAVFALSIGFWMLLPAETAYLLPAVAALGVLLSRRLVVPGVRTLIVAVVVLSALNGVVSLDVLQLQYRSVYGGQHCGAQEAQSARFSVDVSVGKLMDYPRYERSVRDCNERERAARRATAR